MARTNEWTETLVDWVSGRLRQNRFSNLWLGGGPGADGGSSYRPIDGQLTQRHVCYDNSEDASPCSPSGFSSLVDNLRRIRYWQEPATWFGAETTSGLQIYIKPGLWYPSTTEYCAFAGGNSPTFTLPGALDRIDTVYIDPSGILHIQRGVPAVSPTITLPPIASGIPLWAVYLPPTASGVYFQVCSGYYAGQAYIERDLRPFLNLGGGGAVASGVLPASNRGAILRGGIADWETYNVGAANEVLTNDGTDVMWSTGAINLTAGKTLIVSVNLTLAGVDGKSLTIEENSILNQDLTTDASVTFADVFVPNGGTFGISGNELLTVNAAGNFTFSGVTSIVVPTLTWIGVNANCSWMFDSGNGDITTLVRLGVGTIVPHTTIESRNDTAFDTSYLESGQDNIMLACNLPVGIGNYGSSIVFDKLDGYGNYRRAAIVAIQTTTDKDQVGLQFFTHPGAGSGDPIVAAVIITHAGYVGIGLAAPNQKLTVEGTIDLKEQAAANPDTAAYGQIWVKSTAPNELWFTDDTGVDVQLGVGGGALPAVAGAGYALVSDGVNSWVADQTPAWTGEHSFGAGIAFTGATGVNAITIPDNLANALHIIDAGDADVYLQIVTTTGSEEVIFNAGGDDVDFTVQAIGVADALQVRGSDGQITLGVLTAGYVKSSAGGVLSIATEVPLIDLGSYTQGDLIYGGVADWQDLAIGGIGDFLWVNAAGTEPEWHTLVAGDVPAHALLGTQHSDTTTDAPTRGSLIYGNATSAWDELVHPGYSYGYLQTTLTDLQWSADLDLADGHYVGANGDLRIIFDLASGDLKLNLGDAAGSDEVQVVDSGGIPMLRIDSNGNVIVVNGAYVGIGAAAERVVFDAAGDICMMGANFGLGLLNPNVLAHLYKDNGAGLGPTLKLDNNAHADDAGATSQVIFVGAADSRYANILHTARGNFGKPERISIGITDNSDVFAEVLVVRYNHRVGINTLVPAGKCHIDQSSTTAAIPVLILDQADLSEEFIELTATVGAGNPIDTAAIGTYYGKMRVNVTGVGHKYIALYNS